MNKSIIFLFLSILITVVHVRGDDDLEDYGPKDKEIVRAVVESCAGCRLNKLPDVKAFIYEDLPYFHNVQFKKVGGAPPELVLLNKDDEEIWRVPLEVHDREDCNNLLLDLGFYKKSSKDDEVPERYLKGPYKPKDEL